MRRSKDDTRPRGDPQYSRDRSRSRSRDREDNLPKDAFGRDVDRGRARKGDWNGQKSIASSASSQRKSRFAPASSSSASTSSSLQKQVTSVGTEEVDKIGDGNGDGDDDEGDDGDDDDEMMRLMGFGGFGSSKGKHVADNEKAAAGAANVSKQRKYRQYMNRREGFNTALASVD